MAKTKTKGKTRQSFKFLNNKVQKGEILMIASLTHCNSHVIIYQFQLSKSKKGRNLHDSLVNTVQQLHNHLSASAMKVQAKKRINKLCNCNSCSTKIGVLKNSCSTQHQAESRFRILGNTSETVQID